MSEQSEIKRTLFGVSIPNKKDLDQTGFTVALPGKNRKIMILRCPCCTAIQANTQPCVSGDMVKQAFKEFAIRQGYKSIVEFGLKDTDGGGKVWGAKMA